MKDWVKFREQEQRDMKSLAYEISSPLHYSTGIPQGKCTRDSHPPCGMCSNAARLVVQSYGPTLERRFVQKVGDLFDISTGWSPPCSD